MQESIWQEKRLTDKQLEQQQMLVRDFSVPPILAKLYVQRGLTTFADIQDFCNPTANALHDPFLFNDMYIAVNRLNRAISENQTILIYGDYDVDGTTSIALVYRYLYPLYPRLLYYVPDRDTEGYGISQQGVDFAIANGVKLIIALDCGIKDNDMVDYGNAAGIDFIICDHHNPGEQLPNAVAILDAKRADNTYPYSELSGCGVGYKFMQAFAISNHYEPETLYPLLDILALSIASDVVPLTGENRTLISLGIQRINTQPSLGLATLLRKCNLFIGTITISDIVFKIGPRINASGRIKSANVAVDLLIATDYNRAIECCDIIEQLNEQRRQYDHSTTEQALQLLDADPLTSQRVTTVVYSPKWHKGVVGIVASRLIEKYYKPTIVLTDANGKISGSARSVSDFDLYSAIKACADDLEAFGGHDFAAGLTLLPDKLDDFRQHFEQYVAAHITPQQQMPLIQYDQVITLADVNKTFFKQLQALQPYGQDNPQPVFVTRGVYNVAATRLVGQTQEHLRLEINDGTLRDGDKLIGIAFNKREFFAPMYQSKKVDICYTIEENVFRGTSTLQLNVKDIKLSE